LLVAYATLLFLLSVILIGIFQRLARKGNWLDVPNARSAHQEPTPRGAGIIFMGLWLVTVLLLSWRGFARLPEPYWCRLLLAIGLITLLGFWEDRTSLSIRFRLAAQTGIALYALWVLGSPNVGLFNWSWAAWLLTLFALVWSVNLFNFMDGLDGFAGMEAIQILGIGGGLFALVGMWSMALVAWSLGICVLGYLCWNWPRATVFMGDSGSYSLGFVIALFALLGDRWFELPLGIWVILYAAFWFDASVTLIRRFLQGETWYQAHKSHAYQRLHQAGWSPYKIMFSLFLLNIVLAGLAWGVFAFWIPFQTALCLTLLILMLVYVAIEKRFPMKKSQGSIETSSVVLQEQDKRV